MTVDNLPFRVEVIASAKRKRTVGAQLRGDLLEVRVPRWMTLAERARWADDMARRFAGKLVVDDAALAARAGELARRYGLPVPDVVRWDDRLQAHWGTCVTETRTIRLSNRLASLPAWVRDYVIVHELAHLRVGPHNRAFWALVRRYPKTERAIGYLMAKADDPAG